MEIVAIWMWMERLDQTFGMNTAKHRYNGDFTNQFRCRKIVLLQFYEIEAINNENANMIPS